MTSPCNNICKIDEPSGYCIGCGRTMAEIAQWPGASSDQRQQILSLLPARMQAMAENKISPD
ncbi:DUF1289 domain-containing protein [Parasphingorhabdus sp.]|uniref:DUF1289 domain-containing protein n=1 Tax=Parasphingorhabdus sp. TaxID=2709688 RepID=UPI00329C6201